MTVKKPSSPNIRQLRALGHKLHPVVTIAGNGLSPNVMLELERALTDHELIKIKIAVGSREGRDAMLTSVQEGCGAELIQRVGNIALLLRKNPEPDPRKSNLIRLAL